MPWARSFCPFRAYWVISTVQVELILLFTQSLGMPLYKGGSRGEEWVKRGEELRKTLHPPQHLYIKGIRAVG